MAFPGFSRRVRGPGIVSVFGAGRVVALLQVNGYRGETDTEEKIRRRVAYDLYYIENWSIALDLRILARTLLVVLKGKNAY